MNQQISPAIIAGGVGAAVVILGIVGYFVFSPRQVATTPIVTGTPPPAAAAQLIGPGGTARVPMGMGGPPPAASQTMGSGTR